MRTSLRPEMARRAMLWGAPLLAVVALATEAFAVSVDSVTDLSVLPLVEPITPGSSATFSATVRSTGAAVPGPIEVDAYVWQLATGLSGPAPWSCLPSDGSALRCTHPGPIPAGGSLPALLATVSTTANGLAPPGDLASSWAMGSYCDIWPETNICIGPDLEVFRPGSPKTFLAYAAGRADLTQEVFRPDTGCTPNPAGVGSRITCTMTPVNTESTPLGSSIGMRFYVPDQLLPQNPAFSGTGWSCDFSGATYWLCTHPGGLAAGASGDPVTVEFDATQAATFQFFGGSPIVDGYVGPAIGVGLEVLPTLGALAVTGPSSAFAGEATSFEFAVSNPGDTDFGTPLTVSVLNLSGLYWTGMLDDPSGEWSCSDNAGVIQCSFAGTLAAHGVAPRFSLEFVATDASYDCSMLAGACVHFDTQLDDGSGVLATLPTEINLLSGLLAVINASPSTLDLSTDTDVQFAVAITNQEWIPVNGVQVDIRPSSLSLVHPTVVDDGGGEWSCATVLGSGFDEVIRCSTSAVLLDSGGAAPTLVLSYELTAGPYYPCLDPGSVGPRCATGEIAELQALDTGLRADVASMPKAEVSITGAVPIGVVIDHLGNLAPQSGLIDVELTVSNDSGATHPGPVRILVDACQNEAYCTTADNFVDSLVLVSPPWTCEPADPATSAVWRLACTYPNALDDAQSATATLRFVTSASILPTVTCAEGLCALFRASYGLGDGVSLGDPAAASRTLAPLVAFGYATTPGSELVFFRGEVGRAFSGVEAIAPSVSPPGGVSFPYGELGFSIEGVTPGALSTVHIDLPAPVTAYYKLVAGVWEAFGFDGTTGAQFAGNEVQLTLQDGGRGDADGIANGRIVDPGAPAIGVIVDTDGDGVANAVDNCPFSANANQADTGGVGNGSAPDGIGNACQCGDVSGDGFVTIADATVIRRSLLVPPTATQTRPQLCDVGPTISGCSIADATIIRRALLAPPTATISQVCAPARP